MLPDWIIAGAPKAATSSLFRWLVDHPQVAGSRDKETYYFVDPGTHMHRPGRNFHDAGVAGYEALFADCPADARAVLESTPGYLYSRTARQALPGLSSSPRFIFVLREPVAQLKSLYTYFRENWDWVPRGMSFGDFIAASDRGDDCFGGNELATRATAHAHYLPELRLWRDACGPNRMHILLFEQIVADPGAVLRDLAGRMRIEPGFYDGYAFPAENQSYAVRSRPLQALNLKLRPLIPRGALYRGLRRAYRAANTSPARTGQVFDAALERALSRRYAATAPRLEAEFGLDLSAWRAAHRRRCGTAVAQ